MRIAQTLALATGVSLALVTPAFAGGEGWTQDFAAAKAQAAQEGKDLLIDFTGSDWCGWCIKLDKEVFQKDAFKSVIHDDFVLVMLDYPRDQTLVTDEVREQNEELQKTYAVQGFPTIFLTDAEGRPYAQTGYQQGGPEAYLEHLGELKTKKVERDDALAAAASASGVEKAKLLDEAISSFSDGIVFGCYADEVDAIIANDPEDEAGLKSKYVGRKVAMEIEGKANELAGAGEWEKLVTAMEEQATAHDGNDVAVQKALYFMGFGLVRQQKLAEAIAALERAESLEDGDPELAAPISRIIRQLEQALEAQEAAGGDEHEGHDHGEGEGHDDGR